MTSAKGVHSQAAQVLQGCYAVTNRETEESGLAVPPRPEADAQTKAKGGEHVAGSCLRPSCSPVLGSGIICIIITSTLLSWLILSVNKMRFGGLSGLD